MHLILMRNTQAGRAVAAQRQETHLVSCCSPKMAFEVWGNWFGTYVLCFFIIPSPCQMKGKKRN